MSSNLFDHDGHLTALSIEKFKNGQLDDEELISMSEHVEKCEKCAELLVESFDDSELSEVPFGFEEEVKSKIHGEVKNSTQFFLYSLRVSIAVCLSLMFVFSNMLNFMANNRIKNMQINAPSFKVLNSINMELGNFTDKIIDMEVFNNENEKR
ncbi:hypothetical protein ACSVC9_09950 [Clostridium sp. LBM24168]